ncbi:MAG: polysaccharide deacetylase family protein [Kiritimatiellaeota bacterium]|nr:polysaccharide deacetylase family protein [Kiritimatiellota bacterium]
MFWEILIASVLATGGLVAGLCRYTVWRPPCPPCCPRVLMYHAFGDAVPEGMNPQLCVRPRAFDAQVALLRRKGYTFLTVSELLARPDLTRCVALTFDDGFADNAETALPILRKHQAKATIFISRRSDVPGARMLSEGQLAALANDPLIELGAHTLNHVNLSQADAATAEAEIAGGKAFVEAHTKRPCVSFAYPYGRFTDATVEVLKRLGFRAAVTVKKGFAPLADPFRIRRTSVLRSCDDLQFRILLRCGRYRV